MSKRNSDKAVESESSEWLNDALRIYNQSGFLDFEDAEAKPPSAAFSLKCLGAADIALSIAKLRKERQRADFVPLPLTEYIKGLVKFAGIDLSSVFAWLGVGNPSTYDAKSAKTFARLAREIGMSLRETLAHVRIEFAQHIGNAPNSLVIAHGRSINAYRSLLEECEAALAKFESHYGIDSLRELRQIESGIRDEYKTHGNTSD